MICLQGKLKKGLLKPKFKLAEADEPTTLATQNKRAPRAGVLLRDDITNEGALAATGSNVCEICTMDRPRALYVPLHDIQDHAGKRWL